MEKQHHHKQTEEKALATQLRQLSLENNNANGNEATHGDLSHMPALKEQNKEQKKLLHRTARTLIESFQRHGTKPRERSRARGLVLHKVAKDGHCMLRAIIQVHTFLGLSLGLSIDNAIKKNRERKKILALRHIMLSYLSTGKGEVVQNLKATNLFDIVTKRIEAGITQNNKLQVRVSPANWSGAEEMAILREIFDLELVILNKDNVSKGEIGKSVIITPSTAILVYTGNHYEWAHVRDSNWATFSANILEEETEPRQAEPPAPEAEPYQPPDKMTKAQARTILNSIRENNLNCLVYKMNGNPLKLRLRVRLSNNTMKVIPIALAGKDPRHVLKAWRRIEHDVDNWKMILLEDPLYLKKNYYSMS